MSDHSSNTTTFAVTTLGCKVNQADSEAIGDQMSAAGFVQRDFDEIADVYIVNTCTVTHLGDRSSRQMIAQAHRRHPDALLVVTGCYAELNPGAVAALPGVDLVVGNQGKDSLINAITQLTNAVALLPTSNAALLADVSPAKSRPLPMLTLDTQHIGSDGALSFDLTEAEPVPDNPPSFSPFTPNTQLTEQANARLFSRTRVQMKVQDGCDNRCTYCIVPYVRGKSRSRSIASVVEHVQRKVRAGYQEIVLTGIHLGDYHPENNAKQDLGDLISALLQKPRCRASASPPWNQKIFAWNGWSTGRIRACAATSTCQCRVVQMLFSVAWPAATRATAMKRSSPPPNNVFPASRSALILSPASPARQMRISNKPINSLKDSNSPKRTSFASHHARAHQLHACVVRSKMKSRKLAANASSLSIMRTVVSSVNSSWVRQSKY